MLEADADFMPDVFDDTYLNMELALPRDGYGPDFSKVKNRLSNKDRLPIYRAHNNIIIYKIMYEVEYNYGHKASLAAISIVENMFDQVNGEGNWHILFQEIVNHGYDGTEVKEQNTSITTHTGKKCCRETTKGVEILFQW